MADAMTDQELREIRERAERAGVGMGKAWPSETIRLVDEIERLRAAVAATDEAIIDAWGVIANAGEGNWPSESDDWQEAAARWRDKYLGNASAREGRSEAASATIPAPAGDGEEAKC